MALDGALLSQIAREILDSCGDSRVERVHQPSGDELVIHLRKRGGSAKLLISASANSSRIHFTGHPPENPAKPPMFCMLLRKHLQGSIFTDIHQLGLDRVLFLKFSGYTELGDPTEYTLVVEIMGRHSNIVLLDGDNRIMEAIHRVDFETSSVRQLLPGMIYLPPPQQEKLSIVTETPEDILSRISSFQDYSLSKAVLETLQGFSPLPCRELSFRVVRQVDKNVENLSENEWVNIKEQIDALGKLLRSGVSTPTMLVEDTGKPKDFSFLPIHQYGALYEVNTYDSYGELLDYFYTKRSTMERMRQQSSTLLRLVKNIIKRTIKRVAAQDNELLESQNREELRIKGDLLTANIYQLKKGESSVSLLNYYHPEEEEMTIQLNPRKSGAENAQEYYKEYRKADTAEKKLTELLKSGKDEIKYMESVLDILERAETEGDLENIREELLATGYLRKTVKKKSIKSVRQPPFKYISSDGFTIHAGRNNLQNDKLTLRESQKDDLWFHTQNIPGSHVVIETHGKNIPETTLYEAAVIASYHSKNSDGRKIPVDYTEIRNVKKASGGKPGMVHYDNYKTILADPSRKIVDNLLE